MAKEKPAHEEIQKIVDEIVKLAGEKKKEEIVTADKQKEGIAMPGEQKGQLGTPEKNKEIPHEAQKLIKETVEQRVSDLEGQLKRLQAEFENYKKRTDREKEMLLAGGSAAMIYKLLPFMDEMEVAVEAIHHKASVKDVKTGMEMLSKKLRATLEKEGLSEMKASDESFDPYLHEAVRTVEGESDGKVVKVMKKGYLFRGNVLRHAMVVVSRKKEEKPEAAQEGKKEAEKIQGKNEGNAGGREEKKTTEAKEEGKK